MPSRIVDRVYVVGPSQPDPFDAVTYEAVAHTALVWDRTGYRAVYVDATYPIVNARFRVYDQLGANVAIQELFGPNDLIRNCRFLLGQYVNWRWDGHLEATGEIAAMGRYYVQVFVTYLRKCVPAAMFDPSLIGARVDPIVAAADPAISPEGAGISTSDKPPDVPKDPPKTVSPWILIAGIGAAYFALKG